MILKNNKSKLRVKNLTSNKIDISNYKIYEFEGGWARIIDKRTKKMGWISKNYNKTIIPIFDYCFEFQEDFAIFRKDGKYGWIDKDGNIYDERPY